ncbi:Mss4-like protein [Xylogone sp. PMI_703]|nr:Mss4-like protein [Xylogone sp. PMI_703]
MPELTGNPNAYPIASFAGGMSGTCLCGSITVTVNDPDLFTGRRGHLCHCGNCRKLTGSFASSNLIIEEAKVEIIDRQGTLKKYIDTNTGSGNPVNRFFCSVCANPIKSASSKLVGKIVLKTGLFPRMPAPADEAFAEHRHEWEGEIPGITHFKFGLGSEKLNH